MTDVRQGTLITRIFEAWNGASIEFVVLRNHQTLPHYVRNDVDVLIHPTQLDLAEVLLVSVATHHGYSLINRAEFSPLAIYLANLTSGEQLHFDLFTALRWRGFDILSSYEVLAKKTKKGLFAIPHPLHEASLNLLTRLLYHGYVKEEYKDSIATVFSAHLHMARETLGAAIGNRASLAMLELLLARNWSAIDALSSYWRRSIVMHQLTSFPGRSLSSLAIDARRLLRRALKPPGVMLAFLGADGSGKSTVAAELMARLAPTFPEGKSMYVHWKPGLLRSSLSNPTPTSNPHGRPRRRRLVSYAFLTYHWLGFVVSSRLVFWPILFRNGLVVIDRYYYDMLVDSIRYRLNVPDKVLRFGLRFVMPPNLLMCLDAPSEVLQARKSEVRPEESERQRWDYIRLVKHLSNGHVINSALPLDEVVAEVTYTLLRYMAARAASDQRTP